MQTPTELKTRVRNLIEKCCQNKPHEICPRRFEYKPHGKVYLAYLPGYSDNENILKLYEEISETLESELNISICAYADETLLF